MNFPCFQFVKNFHKRFEAKSLRHPQCFFIQVECDTVRLKPVGNMNGQVAHGHIKPSALRFFLLKRTAECLAVECCAPIGSGNKPLEPFRGVLRKLWNAVRGAPQTEDAQRSPAFLHVRVDKKTFPAPAQLFDLRIRKQGIRFIRGGIL